MKKFDKKVQLNFTMEESLFDELKEAHNKIGYQCTFVEFLRNSLKQVVRKTNKEESDGLSKEG